LSIHLQGHVFIFALHYIQVLFNLLGESTMKTVKHFKSSTVAKAVAVAVSVLSTSATFALTATSQGGFDVGLLKNFNVVAKSDVYVRTSDMQCGMAARGSMNIFGGYSVGKADSVQALVNGTTVVNTYAQAPLGLLIGGNLNWDKHITQKTTPAPLKAIDVPPSGTINGNVFFDGTVNANINNEAAITLTPPHKTIDVGTVVGNATLLSFFHADFTAPVLAPFNSVALTGNVSAQILDAAFTGLNSAVTTTLYSELWNSTPATTKFPATGTTTARTFYSSNSSNNVWPVANSEARYNIDLEDIIPDTTRGINPTTKKFTVDHQLYVFDIDSDKLSRADVVRLKNVLNFSDDNNDGIRQTASEKASWVIVRVKNTSGGSNTVRFGSVGLQDFAGMASRTLWVFDPTISTIQIGATSIEGTIIAPNAAVESMNGQFNGTMFVNSFRGPGATVQAPMFTSYTKGANSTTADSGFVSYSGFYPGTLEGHCMPFEAMPAVWTWKP
jgi:choice-of-anchor A domain-containing protein